MNSILNLEFSLLSVLSLVGVIASVLWTAVNLAGVWAARGLGRLEDRTDPAPSSWPKLSVVLAACNEADTLEPALRTLLKETYPALEIVVVNDRSTDETGVILDRLAAEDERIVAVHVDHLPTGWLGKVHGLERGTEAASGSLLLFTDADIHFEPGTLERAVSVLEEDQLDHFSLLPDLVGGSFLLQICLGAFGGSLLLAAEVLRRRHGMALGVGAFNLVRREALVRAGGFAAIKMEVVDDSGLAFIIARAGGRSDYLAGTRSIAVNWYPSVGEMMRGLEKNLFGLVGNWRVWKVVPVALVLLFVAIGPWLALLPGPVPWSGLAPLVGWASLAAVCTTMSARFGFRVLPGLFAPIGHLMILFFLLRSTLLCLQRRGILWRGTHYSLSALRAGQVVKLA